MTEALEPAGWTIYGTRCECPCHHTPGIRHFMACCSSEKRDTPMTKSILSEQREADEALCDRLADMSYLMVHGERATDFVAIDWAAHRIHALSEALQEACHERDGLLVPEWQPIETAPTNALVLLTWRDWRDGKWLIETGFASTGQRYDNGYSTVSLHGSATNWMPLPTPPGEK